jgi:hypothetical protein
VSWCTLLSLPSLSASLPPSPSQPLSLHLPSPPPLHPPPHPCSALLLRSVNDENECKKAGLIFIGTKVGDIITVMYKIPSCASSPPQVLRLRFASHTQQTQQTQQQHMTQEGLFYSFLPFLPNTFIIKNLYCNIIHV